jgi:Leucine-rich repeat (LRR) protein
MSGSLTVFCQDTDPITGIVTANSINEALKGSSEVSSLRIWKKGKLRNLDKILRLKNLQTLILIGKIDSLPNNLSDLPIKNLTIYLTKDFSNYDQMYKVIGSISTLNNLRLWGDVHKLPEDIKRLENLQTLEVNGGSISVLELNNFIPKNLRELSISSNQNSNLKFFIPQPSNLKNLASIALIDCKLKSLPMKVFELESLRSLDLTFNTINTTDSLQFVKQDTLDIFLDYNCINNIPDYFTKDPHECVYINSTRNKLITLILDYNPACFLSPKKWDKLKKRCN